MNAWNAPCCTGYWPAWPENSWIMRKNCRREGPGRTAKRLRKILRYISRNFTGSISLSDLAEKMYTSSSTLSRFFKKQTGIYFADYVNQVRLRHAVQGLLYSDDSITKIAVDSGFSNLSVFNRLFKEAYGMPPNEYRKQERAGHQPVEQVRGELKEKLEEEFSDRSGTEEKSETVIRSEVDPLESTDYRKVWKQTINVGSINTLLMANTQYHVLYLTENLGFRYVRLWNMFSAQMMITDGIHTENCSYDQLDIVLDFLVKNNIMPFLDFGVRPRTAVYNTSEYIFFRGRICRIPVPRSMGTGGGRIYPAYSFPVRPGQGKRMDLRTII